MLLTLSQFSQAELVKRNPEPKLPEIKINSDALTFKPHNFIDVSKYLPSLTSDLQITSSIGSLGWSDEGQNYPIKDTDLQNVNYMKFVEPLPQGLYNLGAMKFYYDGDFGDGDKKKNVKKCVFVGYEHPNNVWQDQTDLSQEECHRADMSMTGEDDLVTVWITQEGEGDAKKTYVNLRVTHLKKKVKDIYKFEDTLGLFTNKEYITSGFLQYSIPNVVPSSKDLPFGIKGMIYTRENTSKQGSFYFVQHQDSNQLGLGEGEKFKITPVSLELKENLKATWMDCTFNRELKDDVKYLLQKCVINVKNTSTNEWQSLQEWKVKCLKSGCTAEFVKDLETPSKGEHSCIQNGVISYGGDNTQISYDSKNQKVRVCSINQYTGKQSCSEGPGNLNLQDGEYIDAMFGNSQWFEIQIRKVGTLSSPRRIFGSSNFDKLVPEEAKSEINLEKDYYILSAQNSQIGKSKFVRAGFFGMSIVNKDNAQVGIYNSMDYYLTIKKNDKPNSEFKFDTPREEQVTQETVKTATIKFLDKKTQKSFTVDVKYEFIDYWYAPEFKNENKEGSTFSVVNSYNTKDDYIYKELPLKLQGDFMSTPPWPDSTSEVKNPSVKVYFYPSYQTKEDVIGPYVPDKIHTTEKDRHSYFASMDIPNLGRVNIECDGKELAYINYKKETSIGMNIRHMGIKCEQAYKRSHIKSFFTKHYDPETDSYTYHILKIINKTGKGDYIIRKIYNLELFDQMLSNAIELDDYTIGSYAFDKFGTPRYQTIFSFDKTYLQIRYLNAENLGKLTIAAFNDSNQIKSRLEASINIDLISSDNITSPRLKKEEDRVKLKNAEEFTLNADDVFVIDDANVIVTKNEKLNDKLKTSFTFEMDKDYGFSNFPHEDASQKIVQVKKDHRHKTDSNKLVPSTLVYFLTKQFKTKESSPLDNKYTLQIWNLSGDFEKPDSWKQSWSLDLNDKYIHQTDFLDLRKKTGENPDFLIYGLYSGVKPFDNGFKQFFAVDRSKAVKEYQIPNGVILNKIYIVSEDFFIGVDMAGKLHKFKFNYSSAEGISKIDSKAEETLANFSKMGMTTFIDKYLVIFAPTKSSIQAKSILNVFIYNSKTGETVSFKNTIDEKKFSDLFSIQQIDLMVDPKTDGLYFDAVLDSETKEFFRVLRFQITSSKDSGVTLSLIDKDPITRYSKPVLFNKMMCKPTKNYVNCIVHSIIEKKDGIYYLGYKRGTTPPKVSGPNPNTKLLERNNTILRGENKKDRIYTYRQTMLNMYHTLDALVIGCYTHNIVGYVDVKTFTHNGFQITSESIRTIEQTGTSKFVKKKNKEEDAGFNPINDFSITFPQMNYWSSNKLELKPSDWIFIKSKKLFYIIAFSIVGLLLLGFLLYICIVCIKKRNNEFVDPYEEIEIDDEKNQSYHSMADSRDRMSSVLGED